MSKFKATHRIVFESGSRRDVYNVQLVDGCAYTRAEWDAETRSDWEVVEGEWLFQGQATPGGAVGTVTVTAL